MLPQHGRAQKSTDLILAMAAIGRRAHPITGRGVGYKLFTSNLIPSMGRVGYAARLSPA